jgi:hypothetical protein
MLSINEQIPRLVINECKKEAEDTEKGGGIMRRVAVMNQFTLGKRLMRSAS